MALFICEACKKNQATVHLTDIQNGVKKEMHLCQECAEAKGISFNSNFSLPDLMAGLTKKKQAQQGEGEEARELACPECGLSFQEFQARGRLGCAQDYEVFRGELLPMIERIHGKARHAGKRVAGTGRSDEQQALADLQRRMREAVEREAYEEAARLRDEISRMKEELNRS